MAAVINVENYNHVEKFRTVFFPCRSGVSAFCPAIGRVVWDRVHPGESSSSITITPVLAPGARVRSSIFVLNIEITNGVSTHVHASRIHTQYTF